MFSSLKLNFRIIQVYVCPKARVQPVRSINKESFSRYNWPINLSDRTLSATYREQMANIDRSIHHKDHYER